MCKHLWTYTTGTSRCIRCGTTANDLRGLPHGHYAVNGAPLTAGRLRAGFACPMCLADINPRVVLGELKILCAGPGAHDVAGLGRAIPKAKRDFIVSRQETDAVDAVYGLREVDMPILDLQQDAGARLKRAGIIRLGHKEKSKRSGKLYPVEDPHFVLKDAPGLTEIYGGEPRKLNIYLPFNEVDRNLIAWHQHWLAGGLVCRGDGQQVEYAINPGDGEVLIKGGQALATGTSDGIKMVAGHPVKCPGLEHDLYPRCGQCRPGALLIVLIREVPRLAYYQVATGSIHNIVNLTGQMRWVKENIGRLQGVPFILERRPDEISTPSGKNGKRVRRKKYLLHLEPDPEWVRQMLAELHRRALPGAAPVVAEIPAEIATVADLGDEPVWEPADYDANGQVEEDGPELKQEPEEPKSNSGNGNSRYTRPLEPAVVKALLARKTARDQGAPATEKQAPFLSRKFQECFADGPDPAGKYHAALHWLWGVESARSLSLLQAKATLDWLLDPGGADETGDMPLHADAAEEARRIVRQALKDAGQVDMFDENPE